MPLGASRALHSTDAASHSSVEEFFTADDVFYLLLFLAVVWLAGKAAAAARLPALVGEVLAGALCGPPLGDWVPQPAAVALLGQVGLVLLVVESGLEVQTAMLRTVGMRGLAIAFAGSVCGPLLIGLGLSVAVGLTPTEGLAVGSALSPTSMGVSVILFKQWRILNTPTAQTILSAAVLDDIIGLVLLSELHALSNPSPAAFIVPIASAVGFLLGIGGAALFLVPPLLSRVLLPRIPAAHVEVCVMLLLFGVVIGLMEALSAGRASYLLGAFLGGLSFSSLPSLKGVWHHQVKRCQTWLLRIFFAATVGFLVPIREFWTGRCWSLALLFCLATLGKLATGLLAPRPLELTSVLTISTAMAARGEFAFLVANTAFIDGILNAEVHAAVMLAILLSLIGAPSCLRAVLAAQRRRAEAALAAAAGGAARGQARVYYRLSVRVTERWGLLPDILRTLAANKVEVLECRVDAQGSMQLLEAFLKDTELLDDTPDSRHATGLRERQATLRAALFAALSHDEEATASACDDTAAAGEEDDAPPLPVDFTTLRGLRLERWMPGASAEEWRAAGLVGNEAEAMRVMMLDRSDSLLTPRAGLTRSASRARLALAAAEAAAAECAADVAAEASHRHRPMSDAAAADELLAAGSLVSAAGREEAAESNSGLAGRLRRVPVAGSSFYLERAPSVMVMARTASALAAEARAGSFSAGGLGGANAEFARALAVFRASQQ